VEKIFYLQHAVYFFSVLNPGVAFSYPARPTLSNSLLWYLHKTKWYLYCGYSKQHIIDSNVLRPAQRQKNISSMTLHDDLCWLRKYKSQYLQACYDDLNFLHGKSKCSNVCMMVMDKNTETNALLCLFEKRHVT